jgi:nucleoside-diphosphate-sugar epimerase
LTAYARSKVATERGLAAMNAGGMTISCLRFATACGMSDRLRLDLVLKTNIAISKAIILYVGLLRIARHQSAHRRQSQDRANSLSADRRSSG